MLTSLKVIGFRNITSLSMQGLSRVNLLVGENSAGKTSVLEAIEILLLARTMPHILASGPIRRGEGIAPLVSDEGGGEAAVDLRHLFHGHEVSSDSHFELKGESSRGALSVACMVEPASTRDGHVPVSGVDANRSGLDLVLLMEPGAVDCRLSIEFPLSRSTIDVLMENRRIAIDSLRRTSRRGSVEEQLRAFSLQFVEAGAPQLESLGALWEGIVLTPEENNLTGVLRIIHPDVERLAWLSRPRHEPGGIFVKLAHSEQRVPIGSLGAGSKRLLVLAMNLVKSAGGYVLLDEIDTGLHYSVMVKMWEFVIETARRLNIQVFATTHSLDCIQALAGLYARDSGLRGDITLHRIEKGTSAAIRYSANEILNAIRRPVEVL
ncbi:hypothetical protein D187_007942 [Cystobacter fuscus DSM 2262]|uniref:Endonuclease GajA/Old nuclease/RecF-like AAA domain-containing protein n=1 Tax=Cystobacter fuscus (strain ATCC 25194 / DSM 2262 / NBRC 100088 / M29) TaxID=1242864 RepID=S9NWQ3_CYSF2|nr:ATP-binding protein [Cystobacter fuscus]EPX56600.1 hypothetical protein D187_007942 [Cystobacter fuscus DSM 2262]